MASRLGASWHNKTMPVCMEDPPIYQKSDQRKKRLAASTGFFQCEGQVA
ncbi:hypothetical protein RRSWK_05872 [Rhodopirellula sp. SWK7]|nr:hypothetical protein RRSWK_05872 [Rhodopirellula sp. SWK7]